MTSNPSVPTEVDAVVCGGGPAGSTFATCLTTRGRSVALFEREKFPRFHIGESLLPWNLPLFERIGVLGKIRDAGTQVKYGARFYHQGSEKTRFVEFVRGIDSNHPSAFQVKRADFDMLLLDHARERGALAFEETRVEDVILDGGRAAGVRVKTSNGETTEVRAKVVVDATGRDALMSRKLGGGRHKDPLLDRSAAFSHWNGFRRMEGPKGGDIVIVTTPDGWWWLIPFSDGSVSVGIVMPSKRFQKRTGTVDELYLGSIESTPEVKSLIEGFHRTTAVHAIADYSYSTPRIAGDGFVLIGDAACFLDPVFSTGVLMAMTAGELAAESVDAALAKGKTVDGADFRRFERIYRRGVDRFRGFVHGFYEPHFLETFYTASPNPMIERAVTTVLGGGVFHPSMKARIWNLAFHACVAGARVVQAVRGRGAFERGTGIVREF